MKSKKVAIILALTFGIIGAHRFYLGQTGKGLFYMLGLGIPLGLLDGLIYLLLSMTTISIVLSILDVSLWTLGSQDSFDSKYNKLAVQREILEAIKNK